MLILAIAYGRGPLGVADEDISPGDLVSEGYERLAPEDQLTLKRFADGRQPPQRTESISARSPNAFLPPSATNENIIGRDFSISVPTVDNGNPTIRAFSLPNPQPGQLLDVTWETFGFGIERIIRQIKNLGRRVDVDVCFGINEAGLVMATFLSSAQFGRCAIGYLKCNKVRDDIALDTNSFYPNAREEPTIFVCDFEVKHADVVGFIARELRSRYPKAELYFAVFGAMTKGTDLEVDSFDDLTGARIMRTADFAAVFIATTMAPPGIEPPLELR
jgi:hypothetical protein